ncbi:LacI family DNA-binding transcriptional regulator [Devosia sp. ZB163]|uniref:LacI family DNA-binding transcriptional regulator n=1 Tax=Devosia sp. ZB163 TaxID=3025938 RepID=UPI00236071A9|nr:LacI family DNA-binding transcriptional regulator [Devosia sp. ZB163]MDC9825274.1 LacI family DNA-binding transcriptional regulator [Devosia sp. ZB163]
MAKRPTMIDIGERAGVSQATVSLVLNRVSNARVAEATRQRVLEAADALGYRKGTQHHVPDNKTRVIGLLIDEVTTTPFATPFIEGAREEAALQDVVVATFCTRGDAKLEGLALDMLLQHDAIGVLYTSLITRPAEPPERLRDVPTVMVNCYDRNRLYPSVVPADVTGGFAATEALLKAGHRRIAHLAGENWIEASEDRERGYRQALASWDVPIDESLILRGGWTIPGGRELALQLLDLPSPPTAIFAFNDRMAVGAYDALRSRGLSVPHDISVVGFDNEDTSAYLEPPLTTVVLPHEEMARWAVGTLLDEHLPVASPRRIKIECPLIERGSIGPVPVRVAAE